LIFELRKLKIFKIIAIITNIEDKFLSIIISSFESTTMNGNVWPLCEGGDF
jgi:hypothetical protein